MSDQATKNPAIRQGWLRALLFMVSFCVLTLLITIPVVILMAGVTTDQLKQQFFPTLEGLLTSNYLWLMILLEAVVSVISVAIFRLWIDRRGVWGASWSPDGFLGEAVIGLFLGPAILGLAALLMLASGHLDWPDVIWDPSSLFVSFGLMALIAFSEELVFRGYVLDNLMESFPNKWVALSISAVVFAAFHFTSPGIYFLGFVNLVVAGFLLGINYVYTKNLWFSFFLHLGWNFFQGPILGFRVSGLTLPALLQTDTKGDLFITGGDFGLEGSILTTVVAVIAFFVIAWAFERKYNSPAPASAPASPGVAAPSPAAKA
jgi:membrane protease YdiL (CAAX protease family)